MPWGTCFCGSRYLERCAQHLLEYESRAQERLISKGGFSVEELAKPKLTRVGETLLAERGFRSTEGAEYWAFTTFRKHRAFSISAEGRPGVSRAELQDAVRMFREGARE